jgi:hypothetical protein
LDSLSAPSEILGLAPGIVIGIGAALLLAGRKFFWLFVGAVGFFATLRVATGYFGDERQDWILIASVVAGVIGAALAVVVQKVAVALAGAATGAYLLDQFFRSELAEYPSLGWVFLIIAAVVGALMMAIVFEFALILLTSLAGAHLIVPELSLQRQWWAAAYVILVLAGVIVQIRWRKRAGP